MSSTHCLGPNPHCPCYLLDGFVSSSISRPSCCSCCNLFSSSSTCNSPAAARYRHLLLLCNNTVSGIQRVESSIISRDVCVKPNTECCKAGPSTETCHDEFTHARSRRGNAWRCAKIPGSMRKQVVQLRVYCGHFVRALRELCVKMRAQRAKRAQTRLHATFTPRCVPQKWHALPRSTACHCRDKMRASVNVALFSSHYLWHTVGAQIMGHTGRYSVCHLHCKSLFIVKHQVTFTDIITLALRCLAMSVWESLQQ